MNRFPLSWRKLAYIGFASILTFGSFAAPAQDKSAAAAKPQETKSYRSGLKSIALPPLSPEFEELGPDYRVLAESFVPDSNRLLAAFFLPTDSANIQNGISKPPERYALVENLRRGEFTDVSPDLFKQISEGMAKQLGETIDSSLSKSQDEANHKLKEGRGLSESLTIDKPVQLGQFFSKPDAIGFGMITPITFGTTSKKMVTGVNILRVQNRLIYAFVYAAYKDDDTVEWVRKTSEAWADAIVKANKQ